MSGHRFVLAVAMLAALTACSSTTEGSAVRTAAPGSVASSSTGSTGGGFTKSPSGSVSSTTASTPASSVTVHPAPGQPVRTAVVHAQLRLYTIKVWAETTDTDCPGHAYGTPIITYLQAHPCTGVTRLLATTVVGGKEVGFAQSSVGFKGNAPAVYQTAGDFRTLVTADGTGNFNDLLREGRRLPSGPTAVPTPDAFSALGQDAGVTVVDAWYLSGPTPVNDPALVQMAHDIFLQF